MKRRRRFRARRRRPVRAAERQASGVTERPRVHRAAPEPIGVNTLRALFCGALFVSLVALKLLLPGALAPLRGTLGAWLARDADFTSAFSAVGHAVSGEGGVLDSLEDAYVAVFGASEAEEVSGSAEIEAEPETTPNAETEPVEAGPEETPQPKETSSAIGNRALPEHVAAEQHVLGFDYAAPLAGEVTSGFGWRVHPQTGREAFHYGVDIAADEGAEIDSFADGTVGVVADSVELGKYLTVHHDNGILTLYAHCSRITVSSGEAVRRGDKLAEAGSTGNATGAHLHFEIHDGEEYLNPAYYLR
ncbi:MAG: M23 family metallopeptidase [Ruminococcaceae bacterium]|nr:M23 family metallopeptidase [Oscillospiraceae bacterium]